MSEVGVLLRRWRGRRRLSQLDLSAQAGVSTRHLSFLETGRSRPTREMILRLAEHLDVPLRSRNELLLAAGFAPAYAENDLRGPRLATVLASLRDVLTGHEPYPAILIDRHWTMIDANAAIAPLIAGADPRLLEPPVNVLRLSLHPDGMAPRIRNLPEWRAHILHRLDRQAAATGDAHLTALHDELAALPGGVAHGTPDGLVVPLRYEADGRELSFFSITSVLGTPLDVTLAELAIESFLPADAATASLLSQPIAAAPPPGSAADRPARRSSR
ncbi:helix-turn-helix transcriptional regulator [Actinoplanes sp. NPDC051633]|uniref:helix-turn-helix transcriptional regulator n=1 Tax=Actinoplanes sp. NPDC051633 TaxID=3155670 RepID=UPI003417E52B